MSAQAQPHASRLHDLQKEVFKILSCTVDFQTEAESRLGQVLNITGNVPANGSFEYIRVGAKWQMHDLSVTDNMLVRFADGKYRKITSTPKQSETLLKSSSICQLIGNENCLTKKALRTALTWWPLSSTKCVNQRSQS